MNLSDSLRISASGLTAQRIRMNVVSSNLANSQTTRTPEGGPYKRKDVVFMSQPLRSSFKDMMTTQMTEGLSEVKVTSVINDPKPPLIKYDPQHPDADENGYVAFPNVDIIKEMVNMMSASRSYEANITAVNATKKMALKALDIGR